MSGLAGDGSFLPLFAQPDILAITGIFMLAGLIKGTIGLGMTTVPVALIAVVLDLTTAMALLLVPSFATNFWQASAGGYARPLVERLWVFLALATVSIWIGALMLSAADLAVLSALLGALLVAYGATNLAGIRLAIGPARETWSGPVFALCNGVLTGMTGSFIVPGVLFLQAIGLPREALIQAMGMLFTLSTIGLAVALHRHDVLTDDLARISVLACVPAFAGLFFGQAIRRTLSEPQFRRVFFTAMLSLGAYISVTALGGVV